MLAEEEIRRVRRSIITISLDNVDKLIKNGGVKPVLLNNGYEASLSLDVIRENLRMIHFSVYNKKGITDIETSQLIADDIIGNGSQMIGSMYAKNVFHFMKMEDENTRGY